MTQKEGEIIIRITYNCDIIKGREIADLISDVDSTYKVINDRIDSFSRKPKVNDSINVTLTILLSLFFLIWSMVLPFTGDWYMIASTFPNSFGIFSFSLLINIAVTIYVMDRYAKGFVRRAYTNYVQFKSMNMETLIALGSVSAFFLFLFFLVRYSYESFQGELANTCEAIMYMTDALTSASIIVLVVTVGKYFESKVKQKIDRMTE